MTKEHQGNAFDRHQLAESLCTLALAYAYALDLDRLAGLLERKLRRLTCPLQQ